MAETDPTVSVDAGAAVTSATVAARSASRLQIFVLGIGLIALALLLAALFVSVWPSAFTAETKASDSQTITLLATGVSFAVSADVRLLLMVMVAGGLGSFVHTATSFGDFVGNEKLSKSWLWWYVLKPFIGMALATVFYLVLRAGFLSTGTDTGKLNLYGIAAVAGLAGMFSKQATDKLSEVFDTLFRTAPGGGDAKRKDDLENAVATLTELRPDTLPPGVPNAAVTLKGMHFVHGSIVRINGSNRESRFKDSTEVIATLLPEDVEKEGELEITVFNPPPGGGLSAPMRINVTSATTTVAKSSVAGALETELDGCDIGVTSATPDESLPVARGGVAEK